MEYYSAIKRNKIGSFVATVIETVIQRLSYRVKSVETVIQSEVSQKEREKQISYINAPMWNLEKWYR